MYSSPKPSNPGPWIGPVLLEVTWHLFNTALISPRPLSFFFSDKSGLSSARIPSQPNASEKRIVNAPNVLISCLANMNLLNATPSPEFSRTPATLVFCLPARRSTIEPPINSPSTYIVNWTLPSYTARPAFEVQFNRKCGSVDRSNECARSLVGTGVNLGLLKLLEGVSVDCDRHRRRGEAGGAHCGGQFAGIERGVMWLR
jgi:hypothetical protein